MKNNYLSTIVLLFGITSTKAQNIIHNASFEDVDPNEASWTPSTHSSVDKMQVWEEDMSFAYDPNYISQPCGYMHSPDWFKYGPSHVWIEEYLAFGTTATHVNANTGEGYVGMGHGELIEQKFFNSDPIKKGVDYTMSFYVRTLGAYAYTVYGASVNNWTDTNWDPSGVVHLKVFLATQKIKYSVNPILCKNIPSCADGDDSFDDHYQITNHITEIQDIPIQISNYPIGAWHKVTFTFNSPTNHNYDWIAIEMASSTQCKNVSYIALDDISLIESCALGCYPTNGIPSPNVSVNSSAPLKVTNLQNVASASLEVRPITGSSPIWQYSVQSNNGITNPIYWQGYTSGGNQVADGAYAYSLKLINDCGQFNFGGNFVKVGLGNASTQNTSYPAAPKIPLPCCVYNLDFNNFTFNNPTLYSVVNNITAGNNSVVNSNINLKFEAGNKIIITDGFKTKPNAIFKASIVHCQ